MARKYNYIYKQLVENESDLIGHIAYSLYKSDKIQYIENFKNKHNVEDLEESDLAHFHDVSNMESSIKRYRNTALDILQEFSNNVITEQVGQIESDFENHLKKIVIPLKTKWWEAILQSVIGAFVFAVILAAFAFLIQYKDTSIKIDIHPKDNTEQVAGE